MFFASRPLAHNNNKYEHRVNRDARLDRDVRRALIHLHVDRGGDSEGSRNRKDVGPTYNYDSLSYEVGSDREVRSEGRKPYPGHGDRVRP